MDNKFQARVGTGSVFVTHNGGHQWSTIQATNEELSKIRDAIDLFLAQKGESKPEIGIPALDLLQARMEKGATISKQDGMWLLFQDNGESICSGVTIREMLVNLIFADC